MCNKLRLIRKFSIATIILILIALAAVSVQAEPASPRVVSIAASDSMSAALLSDGTVWQWGAAGNSDIKEPIQVGGLDGVSAIAAGDSHMLALKNDGTVWAWGSDAHGQLGNGGMAYSSVASRVSNLTGIVAIAAGKDHSMALMNDGTVWAWGYNVYGQIGVKTLNYNGVNTPVRVDNITGIVAISCGGSRSMAVQGDGTLWVWGENKHGALGDVTNESRLVPTKARITDVKSVAAGDNSHAMALKNDGTVWAWGYNYNGQLGTGGTSPANQGSTSLDSSSERYMPGIVQGIFDMKAVSAGGSHSVALKQDGTVWTWGGNYDGELGTGSAGGADSAKPVQVPGLENVTAIAAGMYHTLALKGDGTIWAWGSNDHGQLGNGSVAAQSASPVFVPVGPQPSPSPTTTPSPIASATATPVPTPSSSPQSAGFGILILLTALGIVAACTAYKKR